MAGKGKGLAIGKKTSIIEKPITGDDDDNVIDQSASGAANRINGGDGNDNITGTSGADRVNAGDGDDTVMGGAGDDVLFGNDGKDTAAYEGSIFNFLWEEGKGNSLTVTDTTGAEGVDTLKHFECLKFDDYTFDLTGPNAALILADDQGTDEDNSTTFGIEAWDFDGGTPSITSISVTGGGSVSATATGALSQGMGTGASFDVSYDPSGAYETLAVGQSTTETITIVVDDGQGNASVKNITITIDGVNDDPTLGAGAMAATEDGAVEVLDLAALGDDIDSDDDGSTLTYTVTGNPVEGSASIAGTVLSFDPGADFQNLAVGETRDVVIEVMATDQHGASAFNTVTVTVTGTNDAPTLAAAVTAAVEDGPTVDVDLAALGGDVDSDDDGSTLSYAVTGNPSEGSASISGTTLTFDSGSDFQDLAVGETRDVTIQVTAEDSHGATAVNNVTVTVTGTNDAPTLAAAVTAAVEDGPTVDVDLAALGGDVDSDDDGSTLSYAVTGNPSEGSASISGTTLTFDPGSDFQDLAVGETRDVTIQVTAEDSHGATAVNNVTVTVTGTNDAPTLAAAATAAVEDGPTVDVDLAALGGDVDSDDDGSTLSYAVTGNPSEGAASISGTTLTFDPGSDFQDLAVGETRDVTIQVTAEDAHGATAVNSVTVTVTGTNDGPVAVDDVVGGSGGDAVSDFLSGATSTIGSVGEPNTAYYGQTFVAEASSISSISLGVNAYSWGSDGVEFRVLLTTINQSATGVNPDAVLFESAVQTVAPGTSEIVTVDISGVSLAPGQSYAIIMDAYSEFDGTSGSGNVDATFSGGDPNGHFFYLNVNGGNRADHFQSNWSEWYNGDMGLRVEYSDPVATDEDTARVIDAADLLANDSDIDGDALTISSVSATSAMGASVSLDLSGNIVYDPSAAAALQALAVDEIATDSFTYTISDGNGGFDTATVSLDVSGLNDAPAAAGDSGEVTEDNALVATGTIAVSDPDASDTHSFSVQGGGNGNYGSLSIDGNGDWTYTLNNGAANVQALAQGQTVYENFTVNVSDGNGGFTSAPVQVAVSGTNDAPVAQNVTLVAAVTGNSGFDNGWAGWTRDAGPNGGLNGIYISGSYNHSFSINTSGNLIPGDFAVADISFNGWLNNYYDGPNLGTAFGPKLISDDFVGRAGDLVSFEYRAYSGGDAASIRAELINVNTGAVTPVFFDQTPTGSTSPVTQIDVPIAAAGNYRIEFTVGSFDATDGGYVGARLAIGTAGIVRSGVSEGDATTFEAIQFLGDATDVDNGATISLHSVDATSALGASVSIDAAGNVFYDASGITQLGAGESAVDTFTYWVTDEHGALAQAEASITVNGVNDDPTATGGTGSVTEDGSLVASGNLGASDPDANDTLSYSLVGSATGTYGSIGIDSNGNWTYTLNNDDPDLDDLDAGMSEVDSFVFNVSDGNGGVTTATVDVTVNGADEAPEGIENGTTLFWQYSYPYFGQNYLGSGQDITVVDGIELTGLWGGSSWATVDISDDGSIFIDFYAGATWSTGAFNGWRIVDNNDLLPDITGFTLDTNMAGLDASDVGFHDDSIWINWNGLSFNSNTYVDLTLEFG